MSSPEIEHLSLETETDSDANSTTDSQVSTDDEITEDHDDTNPVGRAIEVIDEYLGEKSAIYPMLQYMRSQEWNSPEADDYFSDKKLEAEENPAEAIAKVDAKMWFIAAEIQELPTKPFAIEPETKPKRILDLSVTPGAFLTYALDYYYRAHALAFNLPEEDGGFAPTLEESECVRIQMLDITMFAADMGVDPDEIPKSHRLADKLRHSYYFDGSYYDSRFDLAICDSTIEPRWGVFRGSREYRRRLLTQLVIGLQNLREGGTMIIQLHKLESIQTMELIRKFTQFAKVTIFKHDMWVGKLACFYLVASKVESRSWKAITAMQRWKREWKVVTLGTKKEWRAERDRLARCGNKGVKGVLEDPQLDLLELGKYVWQKQIDLLARPPW